MTIATAPTPTSQPLPPVPPAARHHPNPLRVIPILLVVLAVGGGLAWRWFNISAEPARLTASGYVEATEITIASETTGRVVEVLAREGETVRAGDELVRLDDSTLQIQYRQSPPETQTLIRDSMSRLVLKTPIDGVVLHRSIQPGEVATPGAPLMTVADVTNLELTIYLRTADIGVIQIGQDVAITSESLPGQEFRGQITSIATKAEFTPKNVQTQRDRLGLVYAVKVSIRSDGRLKPGLPVDARVLAD